MGFDHRATKSLQSKQIHLSLNSLRFYRQVADKLRSEILQSERKTFHL